jgi:hypothetical protein
MEGTDPLATYDMAACGLGGNVTNQGWLHLANPGSSGLCLKQFSSANIGNTAGFSRRFSLAEGEAAINVGDNLKEIADMKSLTQAMCTLDLAARHVMNWNYSISALYCFLEGNEYCATELANHPNRVGEVVNFVNHVLGVNAQNWIKEECFLTAPELSREFPIWLQSRPSTAAATAATATVKPPTKTTSNRHTKVGPGEGAASTTTEVAVTAVASTQEAAASTVPAAANTDPAAASTNSPRVQTPHTLAAAAETPAPPQPRLYAADTTPVPAQTTTPGASSQSPTTRPGTSAT